MHFVWREQHKERGWTEVFTFLEYHAWPIPSASHLLTHSVQSRSIYLFSNREDHRNIPTLKPYSHVQKLFWTLLFWRSFRCNFLFHFFSSFVSSISSNLTQNIFSSAQRLNSIHFLRFVSPLATVLHTKRHQRGNSSIISRKERLRYS